MGMESWKEKYYSEDEMDGFRYLYHVPTKDEKIAAIEHSLKKWEGLRPEILQKHGVKCANNTYVLTSDSAFDEDAVQINSESCALCAITGSYESAFPHEMREEIKEMIQNAPQNEYIDQDDSCCVCPIFKANERSCGSEYGMFGNTGNAVPMIELLNKTLNAYLSGDDSDAL